MERQRFEDSWKESFEDAEVSPSDNVWTNIELDLEKENGSKMKRRIIFFQLLAAASIAFAMTFAGVGVYFMLQNSNAQPQLASNVANTQAQKENITTTPDKTTAEKQTGLSTSIAQGLNNTTAPNTAMANETQDQNMAAAYSTTPGVANHTGATAEANPAIAQNAAESPHAQAITRAETRQPRRPLAQQPTVASNTAASAKKHQDPSQTQSPATIARVDSPTAQSTSSDRTVFNGTPAADRSAADRAAADQSAQQATLLAQSNISETVKRKRSSHAAEAEASHNATQASNTSRQSIAAASNNSTKQSQGATTGIVRATQQTDQTEASSSVSTPSASHQGTTTTQADASITVAEAGLSKTQGKLPVMAHPAEPSLMTTTNQADPVVLMLARLNDQEKLYAQQEKDDNKKDKGSERLWTSVGFAAGAYNMVTSGGGNSSAAAASFVDQQAFSATSNTALTNSIVHEQSSAPGVSYSVGLNMGTKLAPRWVLQGGVNYLTQSSDYTTSAAVGSPDNSFKPASINELDKISSTGRQEARVISTAAYRVNSNLQYFSVPLQAGYLVVNRAFGLQFNAGVSTDLFLRNTLTPDGGSLEKTTQTRSDDSPYRPVNFSGLVGTEFSYRFGPHYRIALNPGLRYPFSSIYKSDITVSAMPLTFDIGLKFRYIFH